MPQENGVSAEVARVEAAQEHVEATTNFDCADSACGPSDDTMAEQVSDWKDSLPGRFKDLQYVSRSCCSTKFAAQTSACKAVCCVVDTRSGNPVTLERLARPFRRSEPSTRLYAELALLMHMKHENIVGLVDCFGDALTCPVDQECYYLHVVTSRNPNACSLQTIIRSETLNEEHVRFITYQILRGLKYLHSARIVHGDLRPSNVVIDEDCQVMIADLGIRQHVSHSAASTPVSTVAPPAAAALQDVSPATSRTTPAADSTTAGRTRSNSMCSDGPTPRTPLEFNHVFNSMKLNAGADVWAVGCILAELITCRPLFRETDHVSQLVQILLLAGQSPQMVLERLPNDGAIRQHAKSFLYLNPRNRPFEEVFKGAHAQAIDVLQQMLTVDLSKRVTVVEALRHKYMFEFHDPDDEPTTVEFEPERLAAQCSTFQSASEVQSALRSAVSSWREQRLKRIHQDAAEEPCLTAPPLKHVTPGGPESTNLTVVLSA